LLGSLIIFKLFFKSPGHGFKILGKVFSPEFQSVRFHMFRPASIQRWFLLTNFQKSSYFRLVIRSFFKLPQNCEKMNVHARSNHEIANLGMMVECTKVLGIF